MRLNLLILILFFSTIPLKSQQVEISAVVYSIVSGVQMSYMVKDRQAFKDGDPYQDYQKKWRLLLPVEVLSLVNVGFSMAVENHDKSFSYVVTDLVLVGSIRWLIRDGFYQLMYKENFFKLPNTENTFFSKIEKLGSPLFKIFLVASVLVFKYFLLPLL